MDLSYFNDYLYSSNLLPRLLKHQKKRNKHKSEIAVNDENHLIIIERTKHIFI